MELYNKLDAEAFEFFKRLSETAIAPTEETKESHVKVLKVVALKRAGW